MSSRILSALLRMAVVMAVFMAGPASAVIIVDSGVDSVTKHFVIDGAVSTVTHNPGMSFFDQPTAQTYAISGGFDASFSRHWWKYFLDGDVSGSQGTFLFSEDWLTFGNATVLGNTSPSGFAFPTYFVRVDGSSLSGDEGPCSFPFGPDTYCSGFSSGPIASLTGVYEDGSISLQGSMPIVGGNLFEEFLYGIVANSVPEPGMLALLLSGIAGLLFTRRRQQPQS